jgi:Flp pilus assembly protein TadG
VTTVRRRRRPARTGDDRGAALVEFFFLAIVLLVPLVYVVLSAARVQSAAYGVTAAAREAGRAYATAPAGADRVSRAQLAARLALEDSGLAEVPVTVTPAPGGAASSVQVRLRYAVPLPGVPRLLGDGLVTVPVQASHVQRLDPYVIRAAP